MSSIGRCVIVGLAAAAVPSFVLSAAEPRQIAPAQTIEVRPSVSAFRVVDVDADGADDLVLVRPGGQVDAARGGGDGRWTMPVGNETALLREPARTLLAFGDLLGRGGAPQLIVLSPQGLTAHALRPDGGFEEDGTMLIRSRRSRPLFDLRVGQPRFSGILSDVNGDGRLDVVVPAPRQLTIWLNEGPTEPGAPPSFARRTTVRTDLDQSRSVESSALSDELESIFRIPYLELSDVNGDGRPDLMVSSGDRRAFHLQREDGSLPEQPDRVLDLTIFRDTTPPAQIRPGRILAGVEDPGLQMTDLNVDGIPDYVISHRRKLWIFLGSADGPRFTEPTAILKTAEDVSALLVQPLDDDQYPDLLLLRLQVPSVGAIISGFFTELDVEISATGYLNQQGRTFSGQPDYKGDVVVRLPAISSIIKNPQALLSRFEAAASKFRPSIDGDFDGDGTEDVAMLSEDRSSIDVWRIEQRPETPADQLGLRSLFFEEENRRWTLDDVLSWLADVAQERTRRLTGGREPDARVLVDPERYELLGFDPADVDGDGAAEIAVFRADTQADRAGRVDVYRVAW